MGAKSVLACDFEGEEGIKKFGMFLLGKTYNKAGLSEVQQQQKMYLNDLKELCGMLLADPDQIRQSLAHRKAAGTLAVKARTKKDVALDDSEPELHPHTSNINDIPPAYLWALCEKFAAKPIPKEAQSAISDKGGKQIRLAFTYFTGLFGTHPVTAELRVKAKFNRYCISLADKRGKLIDRGNGFFADCVKGNELDFTHKDHGIYFFSKGEACAEDKVDKVGCRLPGIEPALLKKAVDKDTQIVFNYHEFSGGVDDWGSTQFLHKQFKSALTRFGKEAAKTLSTKVKMEIMQERQKDAVSVNEDLIDRTKRRRSGPKAAPKAAPIALH